MPYFSHCILLCNKCENGYEKHLLHHSDKIYQIKFHGHNSQMLLIGLKIGNVLLIYFQSF